MANIVRRPIGPNDWGIPEDEIMDIIIPMVLPPGTVLIDPKTGDTFDHEGKKIARKSELPQRGHMKTPHELARAISALINSKPRSPTVEELEGVIRTHCPPVTVKPIPMTGVAAHLKPKLAKVSLGSVPGHVFIDRDGIIPGPVFYGSGFDTDGGDAA